MTTEATASSQHGSQESNNKSIPVIRSVKNMFFRRQRGCILSIPTEEGDDSLEVSYKNVQLLKRFISERGRIVPRRIANVSAKKQRQLKREIKRARVLALLPFCESK